MEDYNDPTRWKKVSVEELTTPQAGYVVHGSAWWAITPDGYALLYKGRSPQCNTNIEIVKRIRPDCKPVWIEFAYLP